MTDLVLHKILLGLSEAHITQVEVLRATPSSKRKGEDTRRYINWLEREGWIGEGDHGVLFRYIMKGK